ncbi:hypothetical protein C1752_01374 [Acaryochloris thomasi RCC1774]|uniref:Damage-inducible protein DinB n=1 Tax=Acaryochloris thomasi RCC1774 TaxID=1764569 RepID=A0A2W1JV50_9CYAN|nr:DinB family protein [Acaryochloris thomasi]PZD74352.1 hypothetical protein C1752_01374 [Acaryochloris thomasi RCC1774]
MIDSAYCEKMAQYNQWMNKRLYEVCAKINDKERKSDKGAFFKSIHATLNHIIYGDLAFLSRFTGEPSVVPEMGVLLYDDFDTLFKARIDLDQRIVGWASALDHEWLRSTTTYTSKVDKKIRTVENWVLITHMFNHETHHRGQITTLLSQIGLDMGTTDLPFLPGIEA